MRLFIRPKFVPGSPIARHKTSASMISWILRLPVETIRQVVQAIWKKVKEYAWALVRVVILSVVFIIAVLLVYQPQGGVKEAAERFPRSGVLEFLALYIEQVVVIVVVPIALIRAFSLVRRTYSFTMPQRKKRKMR